METLIAFGIAFVVTFYFVRSYVKSLTAGKESTGASAVAVSAETDPCPRCGKPVIRGASFCGSCGAPLELWKVHRATVSDKPAEPGEQGKPRPVINASLCIGCGTCIDVCPEAGALAMVNGKAILASPEKCTGQAKCVDACPTSGITLAFGDTLQTVTVPFVKEDFETNIPGVFIVGELGGMGLIKTAINEGRLGIDHVRKRLNGCATEPNGAGPADVIIVGAGPAGLSATLTAQQYGLKYLTFDQGEVASTIRHYPRHKFLMAEPVQMPLYGSLYIADGTKETLVSVWENIIANTGIEVKTNEGVESVVRSGDYLEVRTAQGKYLATHVLLAMGKRGTPRRLGVPGEDLGKVSYRLIEAESYESKDLLVVGGGDSAVEAALALSRSKRNRVTLAYRKDEFSRARERNRSSLQQAEENGLLRVLRSIQVTQVRSDSVSLVGDEGPLEVPNQFVFVMIGGESPEGFLRKTGIEIVQKTVTA
ncbi:MAG: NAD(P)-binding domain-containing protein [bacterium]|nr:NAD(P)-binding domain-containing protein [bacterium]